MKQGWEYKKLGDCTQILDSQRKPVTKKDRKGGVYPYYGQQAFKIMSTNIYLMDVMFSLEKMVQNGARLIKVHLL